MASFTKSMSATRLGRTLSKSSFGRSFSGMREDRWGWKSIHSVAHGVMSSVQYVCIIVYRLFYRVSIIDRWMGL